MTQSIPELLSGIEKDPSTLGAVASAKPAVALVLQHAFDPEKKFLLPEGEPPFKPSNLPVGTFENTLHNEARRLYILCRDDLKAEHRERIFIQMLESFEAETAKVLLAVKDQALSVLYPHITLKAVQAAGIVPTPPVVEPVIPPAVTPVVDTVTAKDEAVVTVQSDEKEAPAEEAPKEPEVETLVEEAPEEGTPVVPVEETKPEELQAQEPEDASTSEATEPEPADPKPTKKVKK